MKHYIEELWKRGGRASSPSGAGGGKAAKTGESGENDDKTPEKHRRNRRKHRHKGQKHRHKGIQKVAYMRKKQYLCSVKITDTLNSPKLKAKRITRPQEL